MARSKERNFGQVIRERRRQLDLTQEEVARRIRTSTPYVGHLEALLGTELEDTSGFNSAATVSRSLASVGWAGTHSS